MIDKLKINEENASSNNFDKLLYLLLLLLSVNKQYGLDEK